MTKKFNIDSNIIKIKKNLFRKRVICYMDDGPEFIFNTKYSFTFSQVDQIIQEYYKFLLSGNRQYKFTNIIVKRNRDIVFYNIPKCIGIRIGCIFFEDEQVHLIHSEIL